MASFIAPNPSPTRNPSKLGNTKKSAKKRKIGSLIVYFQILGYDFGGGGKFAKSERGGRGG